VNVSKQKQKQKQKMKIQIQIQIANHKKKILAINNPVILCKCRLSPITKTQPMTIRGRA